MKLRSQALIAASTAAALSAAIAVPALTNAQSAAGTTITVQEKLQGLAMDDVAPKSKSGPGSVSLGDRLTTRQALFDASKRRLGTLYTDCTGVGPTKSFDKATLLCTTTYALAGGQIVAAGHVKLDGSTGGLPIVAGTGQYAGARGTVTTGKPAKGYDSSDTITITG